MSSRCLHFFLVLASVVLLSPAQLYAQDEKDHATYSHPESTPARGNKFDFVLRFGQGGFRDSRPSDGIVGGGQLALDIKPGNLPVALSISSEYYTKSADPSHSYEISSLLALNVLYMTQLFDSKKANYFVGGGIGWLEVPTDDDNSDATVNGELYNLEAGIHVRPFRMVGFYGVAKYLNAQKKVNNVKVIDFNEAIILLGITLNFGL